VDAQSPLPVGCYAAPIVGHLGRLIGEVELWKARG